MNLTEDLVKWMNIIGDTPPPIARKCRALNSKSDVDRVKKGLVRRNWAILRDLSKIERQVTRYQLMGIIATRARTRAVVRTNSD